jgi:hypothetical protein
MEYTVEQFSTKSYRITTQFRDEEISFDVIVANDESEIPELVAFHLNHLENPPVVNYQEQSNSPSINELLMQQQEIISQLQSEINLLKQKIE